MKMMKLSLKNGGCRAFSGKNHVEILEKVWDTIGITALTSESAGDLLQRAAEEKAQSNTPEVVVKASELPGVTKMKAWATEAEGFPTDCISAPKHEEQKPTLLTRMKQLLGTKSTKPQKTQSKATQTEGVRTHLEETTMPALLTWLSSAPSDFDFTVCLKPTEEPIPSDWSVAESGEQYYQNSKGDVLVIWQTSDNGVSECTYAHHSAPCWVFSQGGWEQQQ